MVPIKHKNNGKRYNDDFRKMLVDFNNSGQPVRSLGSEYGVSEVTIYAWIKKFNPIELEDGSSVTPDDYAKLQKQILKLQQENVNLEELSQMPLEDLADYLRIKGRNRFSDAKGIAKSIQKAARFSYRLDKVVEDSIDAILGTSITLIRTFEKQIMELDKSIERIMKGVPQTLQSIPGVGPVFAAGIIAEIGQIERFSSEAKVAKYAGLYWRKHQSGRFTADVTSLSRNGNQYLRYYLVEAANSVRRQIPEYSDYYAKKYREVPKHQHKRALVLTARKFVRLVDALLRKNQIYTPGRGVLYEA